MSERQRILITGASGFVGSHIALGAAREGFEVIGVNHTQSLGSELTGHGVTEYKCDLRDERQVDRVISDVEPRAIVHAAALARSEQCESEPEGAKLSNIDSTRFIIAAAKRLHLQPLLLYVSTDLVFDGAPSTTAPFSESDSPLPVSQYARTKHAAEDLVLKNYPNGYILRSALVYGREIGGRQGFLEWLHDGLKRGEPVKLFVDEWRTPVLAEDISAGVCALLKGWGRTQAPPSRVVHMAGPDRLSRYEFGLEFARAYGYEEQLLEGVSQKALETVAPRAPDVSLRSQYFSEILGRLPTDVKKGLQKMRGLD